MFENLFTNFFKNGNRMFRNRSAGNYRNYLNYKLINFETAKDYIENNKVLLLDVRSEGEYSLMHIQNAINMPVEEIEKQILIYEQTQPIMVYCSSGSRSKNAIIILNQLGYNNIYIWEYGSLANFPYKNMIVYNK
mgnify:CR=1 FL=1